MKKEKKTKYNKKNITPQTRLMDLVHVEYHRELRDMINELRRYTTLKGEDEWWQVKRLHFIRPSSMNNYIPIAKFIMQTTRNGNKGLKCSQSTFFTYLTDSNHSNLRMKAQPVKSLIYSIISQKFNYENGIF